MELWPEFISANWAAAVGVLLLYLLLRSLGNLVEVVRFIGRIPVEGKIIHEGGKMGVPIGGSGQFKMVGVPTGTQFPSGTNFSWQVDAGDVTLTPSGDSVTASVPAGSTTTSFVLTCTTDFTPPGGSSPISASATVPVTVPTPTSGEIVQVA
jgi:hypothetical protein